LSLHCFPSIKNSETFDDKSILTGMRKAAFPLLVIGSSWNICIVTAVALNAEWVRARAAGGQFDSFPLAIRIIYGIEALLMIGQIYFGKLLSDRNGAWSISSWRLGQLLIALYGVSALLNAISQSSAERFNSLFAVICMWAFYELVGRAKPIN
jgi:hypothetical protein